jgi:hypothetical protein
MKPRFSDPHLEELLIQAQKRWDAMTPEARKEMREAQRKGYVVAEFRMQHPEMSKEDAEEIYEKVVQEIGMALDPTIQRREDEDMTSFTIRRLTNEIIEQCAEVAETYKQDDPETISNINYRLAIAARIRALALR